MLVLVECACVCVCMCPRVCLTFWVLLVMSNSAVCFMSVACLSGALFVLFVCAVCLCCLHCLLAVVVNGVSCARVVCSFCLRGCVFACLLN